MNDLLEPVLGAERWPPMLGVVGFDGGYKSAVALAIPPEGLVAGEGEFAGGEPEGTGACCNADNSCTDGLTQFDCTSSGGIYQGDGTDCASVVCAGVAGACCVGTDCSVITADACAGIGGTYQGDGTGCDPNPCVLPSCCPDASPNPWFEAFDGSHRKFLKSTIVATHTQTECCFFNGEYCDYGCAGYDCGCLTVSTWSLDTCENSTDFSGGSNCITFCANPDPPSRDFPCDIDAPYGIFVMTSATTGYWDNFGPPFPCANDECGSVSGCDFIDHYEITLSDECIAA